jgi:hypothetical protein
LINVIRVGCKFFVIGWNVEFEKLPMSLAYRGNRSLILRVVDGPPTQTTQTGGEQQAMDEKERRVAPRGLVVWRE